MEMGWPGLREEGVAAQRGTPTPATTIGSSSSTDLAQAARIITKINNPQTRKWQRRLLLPAGWDFGESFTLTQLSTVAANRIAVRPYFLTQLVKLALNNGVAFCALGGGGGIATDMQGGTEGEGRQAPHPPSLSACMHAAT